jgi:hypothetical protein
MRARGRAVEETEWSAPRPPCLVVRLLAGADEHHEPCPLAFQPRVWEVPFHFSHRPALRVGVGDDILPIAGAACSSGVVVATIREKHVCLLCPSVENSLWIVEQHDGEIMLKIQPDQGTTAIVRLPLCICL